MGYFTWTDAEHKPRERKDRYGFTDFVQKDVIGYGRKVIVVCPDDSEIVEPYYEGYGIFDGKDIYELVVDWNRNHLVEIFDRIAEEDGPNHWGSDLRSLAEDYQNGIDPVTNDSEWKRRVGITIACVHNEWLPYPIKMTRKKNHKSYSELVPSESTQ